MRDVIVVGAGPAGLVAARELARRGHDVSVLEEHPTVGDPVHCTGILGFEAFDELELPRETICGINQSARFFSAGGNTVLVESSRVQAAVVERGAFDRALAAQAISAGAQIETGARLEHLTVDGAAVRARVVGRDGELRARACVLACGANYRFTRALGFGVPRVFLQSAQVEMPFPCVEHLQVHFGRERAPGGFGWFVPFQRGDDSFAKIGLSCESRAGERFRAFLADMARQHDISRANLPEPRLKILPLGPIRRTFGSRIVVVGDAAGLVKPTTGGGIYYGALSGQFAADVLDGALRRDTLGADDLRSYESRWRSRLGPEIRAGLAFRKIVSRLHDPAIEALVELARVDGLVPLLKQTADFNWHRTAALTLLRHQPFRRIVMTALLG